MNNKKLNPQAPRFIPKKLSGPTVPHPAPEETKERVQRGTHIQAFAAPPPVTGSGTVVTVPEKEIVSECFKTCMKTADLSAPDTKNLVRFFAFFKGCFGGLKINHKV